MYVYVCVCVCMYVCIYIGATKVLTHFVPMLNTTSE